MDKTLIKATMAYGRRRFSMEHWDSNKDELDFMSEEIERLFQTYNLNKREDKYRERVIGLESALKIVLHVIENDNNAIIDTLWNIEPGMNETLLDMLIRVIGENHE